MSTVVPGTEKPISDPEVGSDVTLGVSPTLDYPVDKDDYEAWQRAELAKAGAVARRNAGRNPEGG